MIKKKVLYVGPFELPDRNAAAQRVVCIAKALRELGYEVAFLNQVTNFKGEGRIQRYFDFACYEFPKGTLLSRLTCIGYIKAVLQQQFSADIVIAYNYPAVALLQLLRFSKKKGIKCYADVTEWYRPTGNLLYSLVKYLDTEYRMKYLHKRMDGIIAISDYLYQYYAEKTMSIQVPPIIDISDSKWKNKRIDRKLTDITNTVFIYAGSPSAQKERLDLIIKSIESVSHSRKVELHVVGLTQQQFERMYNMKVESQTVNFFGRLSHENTLNHIANADWSVIIRDDNRVVQAGFPTKLVESITCGTPIISNSFSNVLDYLDESNSIITSISDLTTSILSACELRLSIATDVFDYHYYLESIAQLFEPARDD